MNENQFNLTPISGDIHSFFTHINHIGNPDFAFEQKGVALITDQSDFSSYFRKCIEKFKNHFKNIALYDGGTVDKLNPVGLSTLIQELNQKQIIPFVIGVNLELLGDVSVSLNTNLYQISNKISNITNETQLIKSNFIGYQRHLCKLEDIYEIEENHYNSISLGKIRTYPYLSEPILRDCQLLHINLDAMRSSECPGIKDTLPTGLNAEELCQLMKYAGSANNIKAVSVKSYDPENYADSAKLLAESLWYFSEGMNFRNNYDHPLQNNDNCQFIVTDPSLADDIIFIKNNATHRWWAKKTQGDTSEYLACAYEEYQSCINDETTDRIYKFIHA